VVDLFVGNRVHLKIIPTLKWNPLVKSTVEADYSDHW
jgi:hypothetical protein